MTLQICDNFAKCELINDFFSEQSNLDDSNSTVPEPIDPLYDKLTQLDITETDIEDVLQLLDTTTATGPDLINPRLRGRPFNLKGGGGGGGGGYGFFF